MPYPMLSAFDVNRILFASALTIAVVWVLKLPTLAKALLRGRNGKPLALSKRLRMAALLSLAPAVFLLTLLALPTREKPEITPKKPAVVKITLLPEPEQLVKPSAPTPKQENKPEQPAVAERPVKPRARPSKQVPKAQPLQAETSHDMRAKLAQLAAEARLARFETFPAATPAKDTPKAEAESPGPPQTVSQAACEFCPEPDYPALARKRGWEGNVLVKFQLTHEGLAQNIVVVRSSGHHTLDKTAVANVRTSRFTRDGSGRLRVATKEFHFKLN